MEESSYLSRSEGRAEPFKGAINEVGAAAVSQRPAQRRRRRTEQEEAEEQGRGIREAMEMEYSEVTALQGEEEKVTEKRPSSSSSSAVSYHYLYPCDLLEEALRALFKCFGLDIKSHADEELQPETATEANPAETDPSTPELQVADPTNAADPPTSTPETSEIAAASTRVGRIPGSGRGPQIN